MTKEQYKRLDDLTEKYRYCFVIVGPLHSFHNEMRLASFISTRKPKEYEVFRLNAEKSFVFWNSSDKVKHLHEQIYIVDK